MRFVKFRVVEDENFGDAGILPDIHQNWVNFNPAVSVRSLAHDVIEHGTLETGAFHEEIAAHGSYFFVRLLTGHVDSQIFLPHEQIAASGMSDQWKESSLDYIPELPYRYTLDSDVEEMLDEFLPRLRAALAREWSQCLESKEYDTERRCPYTTNETWPRMVEWYKYGYARAYRSFRGDDDIAYRLFRNVSELMEEKWPELVSYENSDREFVLAMNYRTGDAELRGLEWWD